MLQTTQEVNTCRFCFEDEPDRKKLVAPCGCRGTAKYIHRKCLEMMRESNKGKYLSKCPTCFKAWLLSEEKHWHMEYSEKGQETVVIDDEIDSVEDNSKEERLPPLSDEAIRNIAAWYKERILESEARMQNVKGLPLKTMRVLKPIDVFVELGLDLRETESLLLFRKHIRPFLPGAEATGMLDVEPQLWRNLNATS
jgi:hypothetical protein